MPETQLQSPIPATSPKSSCDDAEVNCLLRSAGVASADRVGWIRITGSDRVRWLNGMLTNSVQALQSGQGCYGFFLNAQGRIQGDGHVFSTPEHLLLRTDRSQVAKLLTYLDHFIIMDDVELQDVSSTWTGLTLAGISADALLARCGIDAEPSTGGLSLTLRQTQAGEFMLVRLEAPIVPRIELWGEAGAVQQMTKSLEQAGAVAVDPDSLEQLRLLEGTPMYGVDIRDRELPQETGQERALHFAKGCYLGQEIVERIRSRGNVHRILSGFRLEGAAPTSDAALQADGKPVGELTSFAHVRLAAEAGGPITLALGYIRREALQPGATLDYGGGHAIPVSLPYLAAKQYASEFTREGLEHVRRK